MYKLHLTFWGLGWNEKKRDTWISKDSAVSLSVLLSFYIYPSKNTTSIEDLSPEEMGEIFYEDYDLMMLTMTAVKEANLYSANKMLIYNKDFNPSVEIKKIENHLNTLVFADENAARHFLQTCFYRHNIEDEFNKLADVIFSNDSHKTANG